MIQAIYNPQTQSEALSRIGTKLGRVLPEIHRTARSFLSAIGKAGEVRLTPASVQWGDGSHQSLPDRFWITRDREVLSPKTVTGQYVPSGLPDTLRETDPMEAEGIITPAAYFSDADGAVETLTFRMDCGEATAWGDATRAYAPFSEPGYLMFSIQVRHGLGKITGRCHLILPVCENTYGAVMGAVEWAIHHKVSRTLSPEQRAEEMAERYAERVRGWDSLREGTRKGLERWNVLASARVTPVEARELVSRIVGVLPDAETGAKANRRDAILREFSRPDMGARGETRLDILHAVTAFGTSPRSLRETDRDLTVRAFGAIDPDGAEFKLESRALEVLGV